MARNLRQNAFKAKHFISHDDILGNRETMLRLVAINAIALMSASEELKRDPELVSAALENIKKTPCTG